MRDVSGWIWTGEARGLLIVLLSGCAHPVPVVAPESVAHQYVVPWDAKDTDKVCADTLPSISWRPCMTVREFRELVLSARAGE